MLRKMIFPLVLCGALGLALLYLLGVHAQLSPVSEGWCDDRYKALLRGVIFSDLILGALIGWWHRSSLYRLTIKEIRARQRKAQFGWVATFVGLCFTPPLLSFFRMRRCYEYYEYFQPAFLFGGYLTGIVGYIFIASVDYYRFKKWVKINIPQAEVEKHG